MRKYLIIIVLCLVVCGCGSNKSSDQKSDVKKTDNNKEGIGTVDITYKLAVNCGDKVATSSVYFGKDNQAKYYIYECNGSDLHLITGEGSYQIKNNTVTLIDNYDKEWHIKVKDDTIDFPLDNGTQTLQK